MKILAMLGCGLLLVFSAIQAEATATLHIGPGYGDPCATGCGGHPNMVPDGSHIDIYQTSGGAKVPTLTNLYLIAAIPNYISPLTIAISGLTYYNPYAGSIQIVPTTPANISGVLMGTLDPGEELYSQTGLFTKPFDQSNKFVEYEPLAESILGTDVTKFGIYVFDLSGKALLGPQGLVDVFFSAALPTGTIVTAFGIGGGTNYETPFTEAVAVPEPSTILLLGSGLLAVGAFGWRRNRKG